MPVKLNLIQSMLLFLLILKETCSYLYRDCHMGFESVSIINFTRTINYAVAMRIHQSHEYLLNGYSCEYNIIYVVNN
jgi:hypothetical protein